ncbi:MAG: efflux RND transporter periplasmic adaptor subunit [Leptospirales bacterium]|jgi:Cu(I)/Ag(I) efflux system membrane fusion protein
MKDLNIGNAGRFSGESASKRMLYIGAAVLVIAVGAYGSYQYLKSEPSGSTSAVRAGKTLYTCSMHPHIIRDEPGSCPICGMELTPFHDHSDHGGEGAGSFQSETQSSETAGVGVGEAREPAAGIKDKSLMIRVDAEQIQKMGIVTDIVQKKSIAREIRSFAHIDYNESAEALMNSRVDGWVEKLYARFTGQAVKRGQALAAIYSPELVSTQEEYLQLYQRAQTLESEAARKEMGRLLEAARNRLRNWNITPAQIKRIETSGKAQRLLTLYSPYSGVVVEKMVTEGAHVKAGTDLFKIVDLRTVWAYVHVPEKDMPFVSLNMPARMEIPQLPGKEFNGTVSFVFPFMDAESRDLKVRLSFRNPGFQLKPGMYATIMFDKRLSGEQLVAPSSAVIRSGTREVVFVYHGAGAFEAREVRTGVADGHSGIQILSGVSEGEAVAVSGQFLLDSESRLQEVMRKMRGGREGVTPPAAGGHEH